MLMKQVNKKFQEILIFLKMIIFFFFFTFLLIPVNLFFNYPFACYDHLLINKTNQNKLNLYPSLKKKIEVKSKNYYIRFIIPKVTKFDFFDDLIS